jgi:cysteine desulfurase
MDYHAHAPIDPRVAAMLADSLFAFDANPHSNHAAGETAYRAVEDARGAIAALIGASLGEIVFTSGATEANNMAMFGLRAHLQAIGRPRVLVSAGEHPSVLAAAHAAAPGDVDVVPLASDGLVDPAVLGRALGPSVGLVSIAAANHEIGTIQPLAQIATVVRNAGALFHSDLAQAAGWLAIDSAQIDLASLSAHKMGGPAGIGALYIARRLRRHLAPLMHGGGQESSARPGTVAAPLAAAFGEAARIVGEERDANAVNVSRLRDLLCSRLLAAGGLGVHGSADRLPGNLNIAFDGVDGEALALRLRHTVALSTGSACTAQTLAPSHVLMAIGLDEAQARGAIRIGLGPRTREAEIDEAAEAIVAAVGALRALRRRAA